MNTQNNLESLVKDFEGCRLVSYQDQNGIWTIGYGHTHGIGPDMTCTQEQADAWLDSDLADAQAQLLAESPGPYAPGAQDALTDFVFNLGIGNYRTSLLRTYVDTGQWNLVKAQLMRWDHAGGVEVEGLKRRRAAEAALIIL